MPRGLRAIHGAEVTGDLHRSGGRTLTYIAAEFDYLLAPCWCERFYLAVPQRVVRDGETRSCPLPGCVAPDGTRTLAPIVSQGGYLPSVETIERIGRGEAIGRPGPRGRRTVSRVLPRCLPSDDPLAVAIRRDIVRAAWRRGLPFSTIAARARTDILTVRDDIAFWTHKERAHHNRKGTR